MKTNLKKQLKGQIEIMGLVIVVILIILGLFFSISLKQPDSNPSALDTYRNEKLASDFLITFLETKHQTCDASMRELAVDCIRTGSTRKYDCSTTMDSCQVLTETLQEILDNTLNEWGTKYVITFTYTNIAGEPDEKIKIKTEDCPEWAEKDAPGIQPIVLYPEIQGKASFKLEICR